MSLAKKDIEGITTLLIDAEMKMFQGLKTPVIFLQNVVVDLLLGMGFNEAFRIFANHVKARYNAEPGFITMNMPRLLDVLEELGIENPIVCSNINKIGFRHVRLGFRGLRACSEGEEVPRHRHVGPLPLCVRGYPLRNYSYRGFVGNRPQDNRVWCIAPPAIPPFPPPPPSP